MFRDAMALAERGSWSAQDLDGMDAILYEVTRKISKAARGVRHQQG